ncbi:MAG: NAD/NADP octopine/nopaline dehydrogenase family protein [Muribaculaceae bacterium]|nr:NAD/NADP octopine/nopaline dehydrogenase family protein [Muribaculaceae bacterium]
MDNTGNIKCICICGGGSLGLVCAGVFVSKGIKVNILSGHPEKWNNNILVVDKVGKEYRGEISKISSNPAEVISGSDLILLTQPGFLLESTLKQIKPFLKDGAIVGSVVSSTGFFFFAHKILGKTHPLFGFQRVPFIARQKEYGHIGELLGYKPSLNVAIEYTDKTDKLINILSYLFDTPINLLNSFYEASLTNSNPILHTGRLYSLWANYHGDRYEKPILFYEEWTDEASDYLIAMDKEFQSLLRVLNIPEGVIPTLLDYYESSNASELTKKIKSIEAFKGIPAPMIEVSDSWIPDFSSRYFTEDFPFGLRFIKDLAEKNNVDTPIINKVFTWGKSVLKEGLN